jgi:hypothetical protein
MSYHRAQWQSFICLAIALLSLASGCATLESINGVPALPAHRIPAELLGTRRENMQEISMARLRQDPPEVYQLDAGDILGVMIENVIGNADEVPPVHFPEDPSKPPAIGFPIPIREDGSIALPLIPPINVTGLTLNQTTELIRKAYTEEQKILPKGQDRIIVTLMRERMHRILVVREENRIQGGGAGGLGFTKRGVGMTVDLPAYENDLLHALNETGGMPGLDAKNEIVIYRGMFQDGAERDAMVSEILTGRYPCEAAPNIPDDPSTVRIPLRFHPGQVPEFTQEDIILQTGDIVKIQSRERDKYYTGGVLGSGEYMLPRDHDLDVLEALATSGAQLGASGSLNLPNSTGAGNSGGGGGGRGGQGLPPSRVIILRKVGDNGQVAIRVNLNKAMESPAHRVLIQPEDMIIVRYTWDEEIVNAALQLIRFNVLFNGFNGGGF